MLGTFVNSSCVIKINVIIVQNCCRNLAVGGLTIHFKNNDVLDVYKCNKLSSKFYHHYESRIIISCCKNLSPTLPFLNPRSAPDNPLPPPGLLPPFLLTVCVCGGGGGGGI